jgi:hypothetical protein
MALPACYDRRVRGLLLLLALTSCARYEVRALPPTSFDAVIIPGCPTQDDGSLSRCQMSRAAWAAILWQRGVAAHFIASGAAVHSRYVEAEAIAAGMTALGVPPDRILIEPNALHTDENMYFSLRIAQARGFRSLAVASQKGQAAWGCQMLVDWGQPCGALSVDLDVVKALDPLARLRAVRVPPDPAYLPLSERERTRAQQRGRRRPPSFLLYPYLGLLRLKGERWVPFSPPDSVIDTWADKLRVAR